MSCWSIDYLKRLIDGYTMILHTLDIVKLKQLCEDTLLFCYGTHMIPFNEIDLTLILSYFKTCADSIYEIMIRHIPNIDIIAIPMHEMRTHILVLHALCILINDYDPIPDLDINQIVQDMSAKIITHFTTLIDDTHIKITSPPIVKHTVFEQPPIVYLNIIQEN